MLGFLILALGMVKLCPAAGTGRLGYAQFKKPGIPQQIRLGQRVAEEIRRKEKILPPSDPRVLALQRVATRILGTIHDNESWAFTFDVIDSPQINAFSLPGGPTFFYTGLMDKLKTEDELAGVLGHELTHVRLQHWAIQFAASQRRQLLINLGLIVAHANWDVGQMAGLADDLIFGLPFSRSEEAEADAGGEKLVTQAGYNPNGMISVFELFSKLMGAEERPSFLSDHPSDQTRIDKLLALISTEPQPLPVQIPVSY